MNGYWLGENCNIQSLASYQALTRKHSVDYWICRLHIKVNDTHCPHGAPMLEETLRKCCTLGQFNVKREHIFYPLHFEQPVHSVSSNVHSSSLLQLSSKLSVWQTHNLGGTKNCSSCTAPYRHLSFVWGPADTVDLHLDCGPVWFRVRKKVALKVCNCQLYCLCFMWIQPS